MKISISSSNFLPITYFLFYMLSVEGEEGRTPGGGGEGAHAPCALPLSTPLRTQITVVAACTQYDT